MKQNKIDIFERYSIPRAVWSLALPTIIGMIVLVLYNLVDTFFIGQTGDRNQVAAVSLAMPVFFILMAIGNLFGIGSSANISRHLGAKNYKRASNISSFAFYGSLVFGIIVAVLGILNMEALVAFTGANEEAHQYVKGYLTYICLGAPFIIMGASLAYIIRSEGSAKTAMFGMIISTLINIVLDPIFIFTLGYGVAGAAIATVLANVVVTIYYIVAIVRSKGHLSLSPKCFKMGDGVAKEVLAIGVPASLSNILMSFANIFYNLYLVEYGNDPVAAMGIVMKVVMMFIMIYMGVNTGVQPLFGYCYGANNSKRLKSSIFYALKALTIIGVFFFLLFFFGAEHIIRFFIDDEDIIYHGVRMLRAQISVAPFLGIIFIVMTLMQVTGRALVALILSVCRQGLAFIPAIMILNATLGLDGLIWSQPVADLFSVILSTITFLWFLKLLAKKTNTCL